MAHFAQIDSNNIVTRVVVVPNDQEQRGQEYLAIDLGLGGTWIQTSYNNNIRNVYAGIGYIYNADLDVFITPKPYPSWTLNSSGYWEPPVSRPSNPYKLYTWNEAEQKWDESDPI